MYLFCFSPWSSLSKDQMGASQKSLILFRSIRKLLKHFNSNANYIPEEVVNYIMQKSSALDQVWDNFYSQCEYNFCAKTVSSVFCSKVMVFFLKIWFQVVSPFGIKLFLTLEECCKLWKTRKLDKSNTLEKP